MSVSRRVAELALGLQVLVLRLERAGVEIRVGIGVRAG
jgi:hypothetical protein